MLIVRERAIQEPSFIGEDLPVVYALVGERRRVGERVGRQETVVNEPSRTDQERVTGKGGEGLIGGITVARWDLTGALASTTDRRQRENRRIDRR